MKFKKTRLVAGLCVDPLGWLTAPHAPKVYFKGSYLIAVMVMIECC